MTDTIFELRQVKKCFGEITALNAVELTLKTGEITGFVGPNGAGKSTCLRISTGLVSPDSGTVKVLGLDPQTHGKEIRERCSYLPGETSLYLQMTGAQFLEFAFHFYPHRNLTIERQLTDLFALPLAKKVRSYSAGMKQQLALIATLVPDVELYLLDEPDRALDASMRLGLRDVLRGLQQSGKTILLSSHHLGEVDALAHRTVFLLGGTIVDEAEVAAAREELRREVRIHLAPGHSLPPGATTVEELPDGGVRVTTSGDPFKWLAQLSPDAVLAAEVGATRLEDLYRLLIAGRTP